MQAGVALDAETEDHSNIATFDSRASSGGEVQVRETNKVRQKVDWVAVSHQLMASISGLPYFLPLNYLFFCSL